MTRQKTPLAQYLVDRNVSPADRLFAVWVGIGTHDHAIHLTYDDQVELRRLQRAAMDRPMAVEA